MARAGARRSSGFQVIRLSGCQRKRVVAGIVVVPIIVIDLETRRFVFRSITIMGTTTRTSETTATRLRLAKATAGQRSTGVGVAKAIGRKKASLKEKLPLTIRATHV
jgi:hypothetical protein